MKIWILSSVWNLRGWLHACRGSTPYLTKEANYTVEGAGLTRSLVLSLLLQTMTGGVMQVFSLFPSRLPVAHPLDHS